LGWLYVCTDDNNNVPPKDGNPLLTRDCSSSSLDPPVIKETDLSSWIVRAIAQGHYSQQQIDTLIRQKANVRDTVAETRNRDQRSTVTHLVIQSSSDVDNCEDDDEEAWMEDVEEVHETQEVTAESSRIYVQGPQVNDILSSMVGPRCSSFCHTCRPSFRERSWASLNAACTEASNKSPSIQKAVMPPSSGALSSGTVNTICDLCMDQRERPRGLQPELGMDSGTSDQPTSKVGEKRDIEVNIIEDEGEGGVAAS
jgi:hypothetical protein